MRDVARATLVEGEARHWWHASKIHCHDPSPDRAESWRNHDVGRSDPTGSGWDFSFLAGRVQTPELLWSYHRNAAYLVSDACRVLDVDTGGGEVFASLRPPEGSVAVEPHTPNVPIAQRRLEPLGVEVLARTDAVLPVGDGRFDVVLNPRSALTLPRR